MGNCAPCGGFALGVGPTPLAPGSFASCNSRAQVLAGAGALVAGSGPGVAMGRFAWADLESGLVSSAYVAPSDPTQPTPAIGLVLPVNATWQAVYFDPTTQAFWIRPGLPVTLVVRGDFWAYFAGGATCGQLVYANEADGTCISGPAANAQPTPFMVLTSCPPGSTAIISTWSTTT